MFICSVICRPFPPFTFSLTALSGCIQSHINPFYIHLAQQVFEFVIHFHSIAHGSFQKVPSSISVDRASWPSPSFICFSFAFVSCTPSNPPTDMNKSGWKPTRDSLVRRAVLPAPDTSELGIWPMKET